MGPEGHSANSFQLTDITAGGMSPHSPSPLSVLQWSCAAHSLGKSSVGTCLPQRTVATEKAIWYFLLEELFNVEKYATF